ncbi:MAG: hypothetical protein H6755_04420 [Candidatus Omnitrophica bacterium]|nr:hypothetical protein [Candidatus Omnitrophota bacterium]
MTPENFLLSIGVILIVFLLVFLLWPSQQKRNNRKKKREKQVKEEKDWPAINQRLEKNIHRLKNEIEGLQKVEKELRKEIAVEKMYNAKLKDKIAQERGWQEKEKGDFDKKGKELQRVKMELQKIQEDFSKEHSLNLRLERELNEHKNQVKDLNEQRRAAELDAAHVKANNDQLRQDLTKIKAENIELTKKERDTQWIARSEYDSLNQQLKEAQKKLERITREMK